MAEQPAGGQYRAQLRRAANIQQSVRDLGIVAVFVAAAVVYYLVYLRPRRVTLRPVAADAGGDADEAAAAPVPGD